MVRYIPAKSDGHKYCGSGDTVFEICHIIPCLKGYMNLWVENPLCLVTIDLMQAKIKKFNLLHDLKLVTCSKDYETLWVGAPHCMSKNMAFDAQRHGGSADMFL